MFVLKGWGKVTKITKYVTGGLAKADNSLRGSKRGIRGYGFKYSESINDAMIFDDSRAALALVQETVDNTNKRNTTLGLVEVEVITTPSVKEVKEI